MNTINFQISNKSISSLKKCALKMYMVHTGDMSRITVNEMCLALHNL